MKNNWKLHPFDEMGGYDSMTGGIYIGHALLDGRKYGETACQGMDAEARYQMEADARLIAAAPAMLSALKVIETWASVENALIPEQVAALCKKTITKALKG
jgi:hypothetical protein